MDDPNIHPQGEPIEGYKASLPSGIRARFWRFHLHDEVWLSSWAFLLIPLVIGPIVIWLGSLLFRFSSIRVLLLGMAVCGAGVALILAGLFFGLLGMWGARFWMKRLPHMQLIPGLIISVDPLRILGLADLGKEEERKGVEYGLRYIEPWHLPGHPLEVGMRIPCVARYEAEGVDRYYFFSPYPVAYATGDEFDLGECMARLGEAPFRRLERLVARGTVPDHELWMLVIDRDDTVLEDRDSLSADKAGRAAREAMTLEARDSQA